MVPVVASGRRAAALQGADTRLWGRAIDGQESSFDERHGHDPRGGPYRERRGRPAVHLLLPPDGLHSRARRGLRGRAGPGGEGRDRADPDQQPDVRRGASADLPGHRHRQRVRQMGAGMPAGVGALTAGGRRRGGAARLQPPREQAARLDPRRSRVHPPQHPRQHPVRPVGRNGSGPDGVDRRRREGGRQREQVEVQDDEPQRQHRRLGARDGPADGRRLVPAGHARDRHRRHCRALRQTRQDEPDGADRHGPAQGARAGRPTSSGSGSRFSTRSTRSASARRGSADCRRSSTSRFSTGRAMRQASPWR